MLPDREKCFLKDGDYETFETSELSVALSILIGDTEHLVCLLVLKIKA